MIKVLCMLCSWKCLWEALTAVGTVGATILALLPIIRENRRKSWIKIYGAHITPTSYCFDGSKDDTTRNLCINITNKQNFDIGIQMAYVKIYRKSKQERPLRICFGTRERHPTTMIARKETNTYFLQYNNNCLMESEQELHDKGIPDIKDISKICVELHTTVNVFHFRVPKKYFGNITAGLANFDFPLYAGNENKDH